MTLIDTHAHIYYEDYADRIDEIIQSAGENGVEKIISVGVDLASSEECVKLADQYSSVFATCGYHPHEAGKTPKGYLYELEQFYKHPKVVAGGEIWVDYHYNFSDPKIPKRGVQEQPEMAKALGLPAGVHCRESDDDIFNWIQEVSGLFGGIPCFSSNVEFAHAILDAGFHISFTGMITFVKDLEEVVREAPLDKMMVETDSPYLSPKPHRGKQNQPANVLYVAEKIAELKEIELEDVAESTTKTALNLFKKLKSNG